MTLLKQQIEELYNWYQKNSDRNEHQHMLRCFDCG